MSHKLPSIVLPVYKPRGMTSYDVIRKLKRKLPRSWKKIGHFGTLDPFAQGLLLVGINSALRANQYLQDYGPKTYQAVGKLGVKTDTGDNTGNIIESAQIDRPSEAMIKDALKSFVGEYWQRPPFYSAAKHEGRPLYEWAREGVFIEKPQVKRNIYDLKLLECSLDEIKFEVSVSTGTYIRSLMEDIAQQLGTIGHLTFLERTSVGRISIKNALMEDLWSREGRSEEFWFNHGMGIDDLLVLNQVILPDASRYRNGIALERDDYVINEVNDAVTGSLLWIYDRDNFLVGMGSLGKDGRVTPAFNLPVSN